MIIIGLTVRAFVAPANYITLLPFSSAEVIAFIIFYMILIRLYLSRNMSNYYAFVVLRIKSFVCNSSDFKMITSV